MVVQTTTALASGQFSEKLGSLEAEKSRLHESLNRTTHDYGRLLELSENLTEQLEDKSLSFIQLEKNYHVSFVSCVEIIISITLIWIKQLN